MALHIPEWLSRCRRRLIGGAVLLVVLAALVVAGLLSGSSVSRAKRLYRQAFTGKQSPDRLPYELDRLGTQASVEALASLLEDCHSALGDRYGQAYAKLPAEIRSHLPTPLDRDQALSSGLNLLRQFGSAAAPAVPALVRIYQSNDPKLVKVRRPVVGALGKIGPVAAAAIPTLLPALSPTNDSMQHLVAEALVGIDPSGNAIAQAWEALLSQPGCSGLASNVAAWCLTGLNSSPPAAVPEVTVSQKSVPAPNRWTALQILGLIRSESGRTVPAIVPYLDDENGVLRGQAASSLGMLGAGAAEALPKLQQRFTDEWAIVRQAATNAVLAIEGGSRKTGRSRAEN